MAGDGEITRRGACVRFALINQIPMESMHYLYTQTHVHIIVQKLTLMTRGRRN